MNSYEAGMGEVGPPEQAEQEKLPQQLEIREVYLDDKDEIEQQAREESSINNLTICEKAWQIKPPYPKRIESTEDVEDMNKVLDVSHGLMNLIDKIWYSDPQRYNFSRCKLVFLPGEYELTESGLIYIGSADLYGNGKRAEDVKEMTRNEVNRILEGVESPYRLWGK